MRTLALSEIKNNWLQINDNSSQELLTLNVKPKCSVSYFVATELLAATTREYSFQWVVHTSDFKIPI